jgi:hypothetical protein
MMAEVVLLDDGPPAVAVRTPNLALFDLAFEGGDGGFAVGELYHAAPLHANVVEVEHCGIGFAAIDARRGLEVISDEEEIATPERPWISLGSPVWICSP